MTDINFEALLNMDRDLISHRVDDKGYHALSFKDGMGTQDWFQRRSETPESFYASIAASRYRLDLFVTPRPPERSDGSCSLD